MFKNPQGELLHHSFIVKGDESCVDVVKESIGNDFTFNTYIENNLTVDTVREIIKHSDMVSRGGMNVYIIYFNESISAQNSLLKALEEPKSNTTFVLITPNTSKLLDTIHSRCFYVSLDEKEKESVEGFINMQLKDKLKYVEKMAKQHKEGKLSRMNIIDFMSLCIKDKRGDVSVCRRLVDIQRLMNSSSAAVKQVLESFAVCME